MILNNVFQLSIAEEFYALYNEKGMEMMKITKKSEKNLLYLKSFYNFAGSNKIMFEKDMIGDIECRQ